jgi:hypothetical protein
VAQALPQNRRGVGGASLQAIRQFGGTFGVALTIAFLGTSTDFDSSLAGYDRIWWLIVVGGLTTSLLVLPMRTAIGATVPQPGLGAMFDRTDQRIARATRRST